MDASVEGNIAFLEEAKTAVAALEEAKARRQELSQDETRLEKLLASEEKAVADEIAVTIKRRKEEVASSYDKEISQAQDRLKKLKVKKEQAKTAGMKERIKKETANLEDENRRLRAQCNTALKKDRVPAFCRGRWFYLFFMPQGVFDWLFVSLVTVLVLFVLPFGLYEGLKIDGAIILSSMHFGFFLVYAGFYMIINSKVKYKHYEVLKETSAQRRQIASNKKQIKIISNSIRKDASEEYYDLGDFNYDIAKVEAEIEEIGKKKQEALNTFEAVTKRVIEDEIRESSKERITNLKAELKANAEALSQAEERVKSRSIQVTDQYGGYVGKENLQVDKLDTIIRMLKNGEAASITEAVSAFRSSKI